jgi:ABC-type lipoprotein export system ATPase subunit
LGGLDRYDSGDIVINGISSKNFKQEDFDTYRNTYVGFIFQEYNVLGNFPSARILPLLSNCREDGRRTRR